MSNTLNIANPFRNTLLRRAFDSAVDLWLDDTSPFYRDGLPATGNSLRTAFWSGHSGAPAVQYVSDSPAYAFYQAGVATREWLESTADTAIGRLAGAAQRA